MQDRIRELREKAVRARQLAKFSAGDEQLISNLASYAAELEEQAQKLEEALPAAPSPPQAMAAIERPLNGAAAALKSQNPKDPNAH